MVELNREYLIRKYGKKKLIKLTEINLTGNAIRKIRKIDSNTFRGLTNLEILRLEENKIEEIDVRLFEGLSNLKQLLLNNNKLKRIDSNTFKELTSLEKLSLYNNRIEDIDARLFESLSNLKYLWLDCNKLKRIDSNTLKGLNKLEGFSLSNNEIEEIDMRLFESLSNLKALDLCKNKLKEIDRKCFEPLKLIEVILIYKNVGLNAVSFIKPSARFSYIILPYRSISKWNKFLQQFPELEKPREQESKEKEEREREQKEAFDRLKIEEENKRRAKQEQENAKVSSSSSNLSVTNKEKPKEIQDQYIGVFLNDRYEVTKKLSKGAFGLVYLVDDTKIDIIKVKKKAMKIMDQLDSATINVLEFFFEINHDNIVRYFDHFHTKIGEDYQTFLITEYCENGDLRKKIDEAKRLNRDLDDRQILDWIIQSTDALKYLHSRKPDAIIHRDIKPENMLLSGKNEIKIGVLGISKLIENTHASTHAGTPRYMSPEVFKAQFMETKYYPNTDVWSLGCVLYELKFLTFAFPKGQFGDPPIPTQVSSSGIFSSILPKMLEKDCSVRISSRRLFIELENLYDDLNH